MAAAAATETMAATAATEPMILDAASILLVDGSSRTTPRLLMGRRQPGNVFLPDKWVFPGGRLEVEDALVRPASPLHAADSEALNARLTLEPAAAFAQSLALAAVRELFEETGCALAEAARTGDGLEDVWPSFRDLGLRPTLAGLRLIGRAVTPPGRPRRYDTRFFVSHRRDVVEGAGPADGEFSDLNWFTFEEARALDLPNITRRLLADLEICLSASPGSEFGDVPFYYQEGTSYRRDLIPRV